MNAEALETRLREYALGPDEADWNDVVRRAQSSRHKAGDGRWTKRGRLSLAIATGIALALGTAVASFELSSSSSQKAGGGARGDAARLWTNFGGNAFGSDGQQISYGELVAQDPSIPLPDSPLANSQNVGAIWVVPEKVLRDEGLPQATGSGLAAAVYYPSSGIELLWIPGPLPYASPDLTQTLDGVQALVLPRVGETNVAQVSLRVGGHRLTLEGFTPTVTASDLVSVAQTLSPSPSSDG